MLAVVFSRKWLAFHVIVIAAILVQLRLGLWQWHRAESPTGGIQNYAYAFQWPLFAVFTGVLWWKTLREEQKKRAGQPIERELRRPMPEQPVVIEERHGVRVGIITTPATVDDADVEVATYNAYLARLNAREAALDRAQPVQS